MSMSLGWDKLPRRKRGRSTRSVGNQLIHGFLPVMETGALDSFERISQIEKAALCRD
jgi:hypothetical protein